MGHRPRNRSRTVRQRIQKPRLWWLVLLFGGLFAAVFVSIILVTRQEEPAKVSEALQTACKTPQDPRPPTAEEAWFMGEVFSPLLERLATSYPVESLRNEIAYLLAMSRTGKFSITIQPSRFCTLPDALASNTYSPEGTPTIVFSISMLMETYEAGPKHQEYFEDYIAAVLHHEAFHLFQQPRAESMSRQQVVVYESEAWWDTVENAYVPMKAAGRLRIPSFLETDALKAHTAAKGDRSSEAWQKFMNTMVLSETP